jgi:hypothetical protein
MFTKSFPAMKAILPSRRQVADDLAAIYSINRKRVGGLFHLHNGVFHIATDCWTDRSGNSFMGVTAHWTDIAYTEPRHLSLLIDFVL